MPDYEQPQIPTDQVSTELAFVNSFSQQFPGSKSILDVALSTLSRYSDPDSNNFGSSRLVLTMPHRSQYAPQAELSLAQEGVEIIGDMPPESTALLEGLYDLLGTEVVRDDREAGEPKGVIVRQGKYHGRPVYIEEVYTTGQDGKPPTFMAWLMSGKIGEEAAAGLSDSQRQEFQRLSGLPGYDATHVQDEHGVNRHNYRQVASDLRNAQQVSDGIDISKPDGSSKHGRTSKVARFISRLGGVGHQN